MATALVGLLAGLAGCVTDTAPDAEACAQPAVEIGLSLDADGLTPGTPAACRDQEVTLVVDAVVDGVLHVHGYDAELPAFQVRADETTQVTFAAARSGQFPVEFHPADDPRGVDVGILTIHEP